MVKKVVRKLGFNSENSQKEAKNGKVIQMGKKKSHGLLLCSNKFHSSLLYCVFFFKLLDVEHNGTKTFTSE